MTSEGLRQLLVALAVILLASWTVGALVSRWLRQPPVVGEILAGILLGPSLLGELSGAVFPAEPRLVLSGLASVGVLLFMFVVGMSIEALPMAGRGRVIGGAVAGSTLVPLVLGVALALVLVRDHAPHHPGQFVFFMAVAMSVTALPVLARILSDRNLTTTAIGGIALSTAATVDVLAWAALAVLQTWVVGADEPWRLALLVPYGLAMAFGVRPALRRLLAGRRRRPDASGAFSVVLVGLLLSAAAAEAIGVHGFFGAFLFGVMMPRQDVVLRTEMEQRVGRLTAILLPVYFVVAGLNVDLGRLDLSLGGQLGLIVLVAVLGKIGGTYLGTRAVGLAPRAASAVAVLMNTRGLTELVILGIGLELGLISVPLYSLLVVMALLTTAMTGPLLSIVYRRPVDLVLRPRPGAAARAREPAAN